MIKKSRIVFFGTDNFSAVSLEKLIDSGYDIAAVITKPDSKSGRGKKLSEPKVKKIAQTHGITVWQPDNLIDIYDDIANTDNRLGVLVSYGRIIPKKILDLFEPTGIINVHPSILPKYRGSSPIESVIIDNDSESGISLIKLSEKMDAGPIYKQNIIKLTGNEYASELYEKLASLGATELVDTLKDIANDKITPIDQDESSATYSKLISKSDGKIDWTEPADTIIRKIRAYSIWPRSHSKVGGIECIIIKASVVNTTGLAGRYQIEGDDLVVHSSNKSVRIEELQPYGKKPMLASEFLKGYQSKIILQQTD